MTMGGLTRRSSFSSLSSLSSSPQTPSIIPQILEEEDPVPLLFLDEGADLSAGIETSPLESPGSDMGTSFSLPSFPIFPPFPSVPSAKKKKPEVSAMRKPSSSQPNSPLFTGKMKKFVHFAKRVEIVPTNPFLSQQYQDREGASESHEETPNLHKKQKTSSKTPYFDHLSDPGIASGLGRAGSPTNRSPNRSPTSSTKNLTTSEHSTHLSPPLPVHAPPSPPPSWRIPPSSLFGPQPHVREPPRVRSPSRPGEEVDLMVRENSRDSACYMDYPSEDDDEVTSNRSGECGSRSPSPSNRLSPPIIHPVIARKWVNGEVRFEDQWGRRLIPIGREDSFKFDLWPVEEDVDGEKSGVQGAWVRRGRSSV